MISICLSNACNQWAWTSISSHSCVQARVRLVSSSLGCPMHLCDTSASFLISTSAVLSIFKNVWSNAQVVSSANKQIVRGLAALDHKLEDIGVLPPIKQAPLPEEITDDDGNLATDCADVRWCAPSLSLPSPSHHGWHCRSYQLPRNLVGQPAAIFLSACPSFLEHQLLSSRCGWMHGPNLPLHGRAFFAA